jgi:hypothetical protein
MLFVLPSRAQMKRNWQRHRQARNARIEAGAKLAKGKIVEAHNASKLLEAVIRPGDRVCLEGDNQKQADLLSAALLAVDPAKVNDLHMVQSGIVLPEHLDLFDRGVAKKLDFAYSGPQSARIATMLFGGKIELGADRQPVLHLSLIAECRDRVARAWDQYSGRLSRRRINTVRVRAPLP